MIVVPAEWPAITGQVHEPVWSVQLLPPSGGTVDVDATGVELRRASGGWPATTLTVTWPASPQPAPAHPGYMPYGSRVRVSWAPMPGMAPVVLATLWLSRVTLQRPQGVWQADAVDSSGMIDEDNIIGTTGPFGWSPAPGETLQQACTRLIRRTFPTATVTADPAAATALAAPVPATFEPVDRKSPWELVESLTDLAGCACRIGPDDTFTFTLAADIGAPVDSVDVDTTITGYDAGWESTYNTVVHEYKGTGTPVIGVWQDTRPDSPLSVAALGRRITVWESREGTPTQVQADTGARVWGQRAAGRARSLSVDIVGRPWLEAGDTVAVSYLGGPAAEAMLVTFAEHSSNGTSRLGLRNYQYRTDDPI